MTAGFLILLLLDLVNVPPVIPSDRGAVVVSNKNGTVRWRATWTMDPIEREGHRLVRFTEQGRGRVSPFQQEVRWSLEAIWQADKAFRPLDFEKTITTVSGTMLASEKKQFDLNKGTVRF